MSGSQGMLQGPAVFHATMSITPAVPCKILEVLAQAGYSQPLRLHITI